MQRISLDIVGIGYTITIWKGVIMSIAKTGIKKIAVCLTALVLTIVAATAIALPTPAFAAGIEDWGGPEGPEENIRVTNNNLTPVKTITKSGTLTIHYLTQPCKPGYSICDCTDKEPSWYPPVKATVQIREAYTGRVLATSTTNENNWNASVSAYVSAGTKVQIFFDVSTMDGYSAPGPYRKAHFSYYYTL